MTGDICYFSQSCIVHKGSDKRRLSPQPPGKALTPIETRFACGYESRSVNFTLSIRGDCLSRTVTDRGWTSGHTGRVEFSYTRGYVLIKAYNFPITTFCLI